jgi:2-oxo-4-hydroxy-4-carboxy-5-ureidoimidazoline decarboxylase
VIRVAAWNALSRAEAVVALRHCCGAARWVEAMEKARPFADEADLKRASAAAFAGLGDADWREAFAHHPKIGDAASLRARFASTAHLAGREQAGVEGAAAKTLERLAALNRDYERRHGFIFIVCATGKSADEMLALLVARIDRDTAAELRTAAAEQEKITALRLGAAGEPA